MYRYDSVTKDLEVLQDVITITNIAWNYYNQGHANFNPLACPTSPVAEHEIAFEVYIHFFCRSCVNLFIKVIISKIMWVWKCHSWVILNTGPVTAFRQLKFSRELDSQEIIKSRVLSTRQKSLWKFLSFTFNGSIVMGFICQELTIA